MHIPSTLVLARISQLEIHWWDWLREVYTVHMIFGDEFIDFQFIDWRN